MVMEIGQDDGEGWHLNAVHVCWNCDHREDGRAWSRVLRTDGESAARRRLDRIRGVEIPLVYPRAGSDA